MLFFVKLNAGLREIGLTLVADNAVAMDGVVARMMGLDPGRLAFRPLIYSPSCYSKRSVAIDLYMKGDKK
jgi:uncharacterized protein (DUF362 family)